MKIGFEIHEQLFTKSKLFCDCPTDYRDAAPNENVCPVCTGMPGSKPSPINKKAIESAIEIALMLDCDIIKQKPIHIQRKHYDYPDLPSGYQRTSLPIAENGELNDVRIREIHIEEDPGKYDPVKGTVDFNRSGIPLVEIITKPDIESPEEARKFLKSLIRTLEYTGKVRPEASTLRTDANISIENGQRVEVKNINSVKGAFKALKYEVMRQKRTENVDRETRAYLESQMITVPMRQKEEADDYRYIPDPDILPALITQAQVDQIQEEMYEAPHLRKKRIQEEYGIQEKIAEVLVSEREFADLFEEVAKDVNPKLASKWFKNRLRKVLNYMDISPSEIPCTIENITNLLKMLEKDEITPEKGEKILREMMKNPNDPESIIEKLGLEEIEEKKLEKTISKIIKNQSEAVEDYKNGKEEALNYLAGQIMSETKGKADPREVMKILKKKLRE